MLLYVRNIAGNATHNGALDANFMISNTQSVGFKIIFQDLLRSAEMSAWLLACWEIEIPECASKLLSNQNICAATPELV